MNSVTFKRLEEVCDVIMGQSPPGDTYNTDGVGLPFFQGKAEFGATFPTTKKWCSAPTKLARTGDILLSVRAPVGPTNVCMFDACIGRGLAALRPKTGYNTWYILYALRSNVENLAEKATGTTFSAVSGAEVRNHLIPMSEPDQQQAIVDEIEKQFSHLEAGIAALKRAQANLKRYRASVLRAACEGCLVAPKSKHLCFEEPETGEMLLQRILAERRQNAPKGAKNFEPVKPNDSIRAKLPEGWVWASLDQLCIRFYDSPHRTPSYQTGGTPAIGPRDVVFGKLKLDRARFVSENEFDTQTARYRPLEGDIVYSRELSLGWGAIIEPGQTLCLSQGMCVFTPHPKVNLKYFHAVLNSDFVRDQAKSAASGSSHPHLNLSDIKALAFPLPGEAEQKEILSEVERLLSVADAVEASLATQLKRAPRLRQAILARAFSGDK